MLALSTEMLKFLAKEFGRVCKMRKFKVSVDKMTGHSGRKGMMLQAEAVISFQVF